MEGCKGLFFRCSSSQYTTTTTRDNRIVWGDRTQMSLLKTESCPGCKSCDILWDHLKEFSSMDMVLIEPIVEHGSKYKLDIINEGKDWETGIVDEWDVAFIKVEE